MRGEGEGATSRPEPKAKWVITSVSRGRKTTNLKSRYPIGAQSCLRGYVVLEEQSEDEDEDDDGETGFSTPAVAYGKSAITICPLVAASLSNAYGEHISQCLNSLRKPHRIFRHPLNYWC